VGWRERDAEAVATITACRETLAATGRTVIGEATGRADGDIADWRHYPADEVYDAASHAQYFYHRHPEAASAGGEHGHFHLFLRGEGMPPGITPLFAKPSINAVCTSRGTRSVHSTSAK
jgi:hypothetical protein